MKDSLLIPTSLLKIFSNTEITKKTLLCILINGLIYMGSVILYSFFTKTFLSTNSEDNDSQTNIIILVIKLILSVLYNIWILMIYIMAMTLNTFWVQDIFDKLIEIQLGK